MQYFLYLNTSFNQLPENLPFLPAAETERHFKKQLLPTEGSSGRVSRWALSVSKKS